MEEVTVEVGRLVIMLDGFEREATGMDGTERLSIAIRAKNPVGSPGSTRRLPAAEVWDSEGRVYELQPDDVWVRPLKPTEEVETRPVFEVPETAQGLELVLAPGTEDEAHIQLVA